MGNRAKRNASEAYSKTKKMVANPFTETLLHTASDAVIGIDLSGDIVYCNPAAQKCYGYQAHELIGQKFSKFLPRKFSTEFAQVKKNMLLNEYIEPFESQRIAKNRKHILVSVAYSPIKDEGSKIIGISSVERQITAYGKAESKTQAQLEAALRWSQHQLDAFFTQALDGFFFMMLDEPIQWDERADKEALIDYVFEHQRITRANDAVLQQYHTTREQFIGLTPKDFFRHNIAEGKKVWRKFFDKGRLHIQTDERRVDGSQMWVEGDYICLYDDTGKIAGHFGIQRDVTDKKLTEEKYRILADNMLDMVALHAPDGTYKYISPSVQKLLGYKAEELVGQNPYRLVHPEDIQRVREEAHKPAKTGREILNMEYRIRKKDGTYIWFSTNTKPITNEKGKVIMLQTVSRNVTEKVATLQRLEEINYQKDKLFSVIGHDLRSPLSTCLGLLDLIQDKGKNLDQKALDSYLSLLRQSTTSLLDLLDDLLMWVSAHSDEITFRPRPLNLSDEVNKVVYHLFEAARAKKISITPEIDEALQVYADEHMIDTVIRNLLSNSIKFTQAQGKIIISAKSTKDEVIISVTDNGVGMKKETVKKLFADTMYTTYGTQGEKGTGLGLELCKYFVNKLGGKIWVESEYGKGSTFSFSVRSFS